MKRQRHHPGLSLALIPLIALMSAVTPRSVTSRVVTQIVYPGWSYTGGPDIGRVSHTATLLSNGKVLVAGGVGGEPPNCPPVVLAAK